MRLPLSCEQRGLPLVREGQQWGELLAGVTPAGRTKPLDRAAALCRGAGSQHRNSWRRFQTARRHVLLVRGCRSALAQHSALSAGVAPGHQSALRAFPVALAVKVYHNPEGEEH